MAEAFKAGWLDRIIDGAKAQAARRAALDDLADAAFEVRGTLRCVCGNSPGNPGFHTPGIDGCVLEGLRSAIGGNES